MFQTEAITYTEDDVHAAAGLVSAAAGLGVLTGPALGAGASLRAPVGAAVAAGRSLLGSQATQQFLKLATAEAGYAWAQELVSGATQPALTSSEQAAIPEDDFAIASGRGRRAGMPAPRRAPGSPVGHGNSRLSERAQHGYEIVDTTTGEVVKTGVSGSALLPGGSSPRANRQANAWNREAGQPGRYEPRVVKQIPAGTGAREQILQWEAENAARLRQAGHLTNPDFHRRP